MRAQFNPTGEPLQWGAEVVSSWLSVEDGCSAPLTLTARTPYVSTAASLSAEEMRDVMPRTASFRLV